MIIYTYLGSTLVSMNPFQKLDIYGGKAIQVYREEQKGRGPHIYEVARLAESQIRNTGKNQGILITGESGAGKTEALKYFI